MFLYEGRGVKPSARLQAFSRRSGVYVGSILVCEFQQPHTSLVALLFDLVTAEDSLYDHCCAFAYL